MNIFWLFCYVAGCCFALVAFGGWAYSVYTLIRMSMIVRPRTMAQCWPYYRRMLVGVAIMIVASMIGTLIFNPAAERLFEPGPP